MDVCVHNFLNISLQVYIKQMIKNVLEFHRFIANYCEMYTNPLCVSKNKSKHFYT